MHKLSAVFQKSSSNTLLCKSKASQGKNQKIKVSIYVKSVVLASSLEIAEQHGYFFQNILCQANSQHNTIQRVEVYHSNEDLMEMLGNLKRVTVTYKPVYNILQTLPTHLLTTCN